MYFKSIYVEFDLLGSQIDNIRCKRTFEVNPDIIQLNFRYLSRPDS